ncbi:hypothetical protein ACWEKT_27735 [Nocardia takedensis]
MVSAALIALAVLQLALTARLGDPRPWPVPRRWLLWAVGIGLAYDSAMVGLGAWIGAGPTLEALSWWRFFGHAVLTPLLVVWAAWRYTASTKVRAGAVALAVALIVWGLLADVRGHDLVPREWADTLRYAADHPAPPIPAVLVVFVLVAAGVLARRREHRSELLWGSLIMVVAAGLGPVAPPSGNLGEAVLLAAIVAAERSAPRARSSVPA